MRSEKLSKALEWKKHVEKMPQSTKDAILIALLTTHDGLKDSINEAVRMIGGSKTHLNRMIKAGRVRQTEMASISRVKRKILITDCILNATLI